MKTRSLIALIVAVLLAACQSGQKENANRQEREEGLKPVSELSYGELWQLILADHNAGGKDVTSEDYQRDAMRQLVEIVTGECGTDCGNQVQIQSTSSDRIVMIVIRFSFDIPGNPVTEILRAYDLGSMEKIPLGCTHFCYGGERFGVKREVLSATFRK